MDIKHTTVRKKGYLCEEETGKKLMDVILDYPDTMKCLHEPKVFSSVSSNTRGMNLNIVLCKECYKKFYESKKELSFHINPPKWSVYYQLLEFFL